MSFMRYMVPRIGPGTVAAELPFVLKALQASSVLQTTSQNDIAKWNAAVAKLLGDDVDDHVPGLRLAAFTVSSIPVDCVIACANVWVHACLRITKRAAPGSIEHKCAFAVVAGIAGRCSESAELRRLFSSSFLSKTVHMLASNGHVAFEDPEALASLHTFVAGLGRSLRPHTDTITALVAPLLDSAATQLLAARVLALLPYVAAKHESWTELASGLVGALHAVVDAAFVELGQRAKGSGEGVGGIVPLESPTPDAVVVRFAGLVEVLLCLLSPPDAYLATIDPVSVPVTDVLGVCYRVLGVSPSVVNSKKRKRKGTSTAGLSSPDLVFSLPLLHSHALRLLSATVACCRSVMLPYAGSLATLLARLTAANSGESESDGGERPDLTAHAASLLPVLSTLASVIGSLRANCPPRLLAGTLPVVLTAAFYDNSPVTAEISHFNTDDVLAASEQQSAKRKKRNNGSAASVDHSVLDGYVVGAGVEDLCVAGLKVLEVALRFCPRLIAVDSLIETLRQLILRLDANPRASTPLSSVHLRQLYATLAAATLVPWPSKGPALNHCLQVFSEGLASADWKVASICAQGLAACELAIHPRAPVLETPRVSYRVGKGHSKAYGSNGSGPSRGQAAYSNLIFFSDGPSATPATPAAPASSTQQQSGGDVDMVDVVQPSVQERQASVQASTTQSQSHTAAPATPQAVTTTTATTATAAPTAPATPVQSEPSNAATPTTLPSSSTTPSTTTTVQSTPTTAPPAQSTPTQPTRAAAVAATTTTTSTAAATKVSVSASVSGGVSGKGKAAAVDDGFDSDSSMPDIVDAPPDM